MDAIINTCFETGGSYHTIAYYSHVIPAVIAAFLAIFILIKTKFSFLARVFALFSLLFSIWLVGDLIAWTSPNYYMVSFVWSFLDYMSTAFVVVGVYFFLCLILERDVSFPVRMFFIGITLPAFFVTVAGVSIHEFYQPVCEALENTFLTNYKLFVEVLGIVIITIVGGYQFQFGNTVKRRQILFFGGAMFLFLLIFGVTEYLASVTDVYEINLYSLLILPVFLLIITFSITNLQIFKIRFIETQLLVYVLIIMTGSQLLFMESYADLSLSLMTLAVSIIIAVVLLRNVSAQSKQRKQIEELALKLESSNKKLDEQNKLKSEFLSLAAHQIRSPLTAVKGYASMLLDGTFGKVQQTQHEAIDRIFESTNHLVNVVNDLLNISKIEQGGFVFEMSLFDLKRALIGVVDEMQLSAKNKGLTISFKALTDTEYVVRADLEKIRQVFLNLLDNSFKYTKEGGHVEVHLSRDAKADMFEVTIIDTGIGMSHETIEKLFEKFSRGEGRTSNSGGSGLGLYLAKQVVEAHKGTIQALSDGAGKGSTFVVRIPPSTKLGSSTTV